MHNSISIRTEVGRVYCVRIIIVRIGMLNFNDQKPWKIFTDPLLIEIVCFLFLKFIVSVNSEAIAIIRSVHLGVWCFGTKAAEVVREVSVINHDWIARVGVLIETFRQ